MNRFWSRVEKTPTCWLWLGSRDQRGYGTMRFQGRNQRAHRIAYQLAVGPIPEGLLACHHCDNPSCVRPDHIFIGTMADNIRDCVNKGRHGSVTKPESQVRGDQNGARKHPERLARGERHGMIKHRPTHCKRGHPLVMRRGHGIYQICRTAKQRERRALASPGEKGGEG